MVAAGSVLSVFGAVAVLCGVIALARRREHARPWPQALALAGVVLALVGLLVRSSVRHQDVCTYASHRCAQPTNSP